MNRPPKQTDPIHTLDEAHLLRMGECVRDLVVRLGYDNAASALENILFRVAVNEAITVLKSSQQMRALMSERGWDFSDVLPVSMRYLALSILNRVTSEYIMPPFSEREQWEGCEIALKLDPTCSDAYFVQGSIAEQQKAFQKARAAYEKAMELAAANLGSDVFEEKARVRGGFHFWYSDGSRPYMRARAALAYLLWQRMGHLKEAIEHFQAMLTLNPGDNQGNRYGLLCCLLEAGDDATLGAALSRHRSYTNDEGETFEMTDTCWHYTNACWQFRHQPPESGNLLVGEATKALRKAFKYNRHVPRLLLFAQEREAIGLSETYAAGALYEAAWYVDFSLKGWQQTQGALTWLEAVARQAKLLGRKKA